MNYRILRKCPECGYVVGPKVVLGPGVEGGAIICDHCRNEISAPWNKYRPVFGIAVIVSVFVDFFLLDNGNSITLERASYYFSVVIIILIFSYYLIPLSRHDRHGEEADIVDHEGKQQ